MAEQTLNPIADTSSTPAVLMALLVPSLVGMFRQIVNGVMLLKRKVYGVGKDSGNTDSATAIANVAAMGNNAVTIFTVASGLESAMNSIAPLLRQQPISIKPDGYAFTPNADGLGGGVMTYTAPAATN